MRTVSGTSMQMLAHSQCTSSYQSIHYGSCKFDTVPALLVPFHVISITTISECVHSTFHVNFQNATTFNSHLLLWVCIEQQCHGYIHICTDIKTVYFIVLAWLWPPTSTDISSIVYVMCNSQDGWLWSYAAKQCFCTSACYIWPVPAPAPWFIVVWHGLQGSTTPD